MRVVDMEDKLAHEQAPRRMRAGERVRIRISLLPTGTAFGFCLRKMPKRAVLLKGFLSHCEVSGNLIIHARWENRTSCVSIGVNMDENAHHILRPQFVLGAVITGGMRSTGSCANRIRLLIILS